LIVPPTGESPVDRAAKRELVSTLNDVFSTTSVVVVTHYTGLTVADMQKLRTQMKQAGAAVKVAKNRLAKIALEGTDVASISDLMQGPTSSLIPAIRSRRPRSPSISPRETRNS